MRNDTIDGIDALIARHVAGTLPLPARVLVDAHLEIAGANRSMALGLEALAGDALEAAEPIAVTGRDARLDAIFAATPPPVEVPAARPAGLFPQALRDFVGFDVANVPWRTRLPGFREFDIGDFDGCHASLFWIRAGRKIPNHTHEGIELTLVLDGAFSDVRGRFGRGDISIADNSIDHRPIAETAGPCIGFAVTDGPLRLTGSLRQRLIDLLGG